MYKFYVLTYLFKWNGIDVGCDYSVMRVASEDIEAGDELLDIDMEQQQLKQDRVS